MRDLLWKIRLMKVTIILLVVNVVVLIISFCYDDFLDIHCISRNLMVNTGDWYRLFTSMFVHFDMFHLLGNMAGIYVFGRLLEPVIGSLRFALIYLLGGLTGSVIVYFCSAPDTLTGGASGCIWCLMAATGLLMLKIQDYNNLKYVLLNVVLQVSYTIKAENVSMAGHFGGFLGGLMFGSLIILILPCKIRNAFL